MDVWSILEPLDIFYGHLEYFSGYLVYFPHFGILYREKSGNPAWKRKFDEIDFVTKIGGGKISLEHVLAKNFLTFKKNQTGLFFF
jgi:hypothetical protein